MYIGTMNEKIKKHLESICDREGWHTDPAELMEVITESKELYTEMGDSHRHYDELLRVFDVEGMIIGFQDFHETGALAGEGDYDYDLNKIKEYEPKEITKTIYVVKKD